MYKLIIKALDTGNLLVGSVSTDKQNIEKFSEEWISAHNFTAASISVSITDIQLKKTDIAKFSLRTD